MEILGVITTVFGIIGGLFAFWKIILRPRLISTRLKRLYELIQDWFDMIDANGVSSLDMTALSVKEKKIRQFLNDHNLENYYMSFSPFFRHRFVSSFGLKSEYAASREIFEKYSKCPPEGIHVGLFWLLLTAAFYKFKNHYENLDAETNIANVENRVRLLKMYTGSKVA